MAFTEITLPNLDVDGRAVSRVLEQFRSSEVFLGVLEALNSEAKAFIEAVQAVVKCRTPAIATGVNLDALGRIVGQDRELIEYAADLWFTPDMSGSSADQGVAWVTNAAVGDNVVADDTWYRQLIEGKIQRNFVESASVVEIQNVIKLVTGLDASVLRTSDLMTVVVVIPDGTPQQVVDFLERWKDTPQVDYAYYLPIPATVRIAQVLKFSDYTP
jgi:hypothetical protein